MLQPAAERTTRRWLSHHPPRNTHRDFWITLLRDGTPTWDCSLPRDVRGARRVIPMNYLVRVGATVLPPHCSDVLDYIVSLSSCCPVILLSDCSIRVLPLRHSMPNSLAPQCPDPETNPRSQAKPDPVQLEKKTNLIQSNWSSRPRAPTDQPRDYPPCPPALRHSQWMLGIRGMTVNIVCRL